MAELLHDSSHGGIRRSCDSHTTTNGREFCSEASPNESNSPTPVTPSLDETAFLCKKKDEVSPASRSTVTDTDDSDGKCTSVAANNVRDNCDVGTLDGKVERTQERGKRGTSSAPDDGQPVDVATSKESDTKQSGRTAPLARFPRPKWRWQAAEFVSLMVLLLKGMPVVCIKWAEDGLRRVASTTGESAQQLIDQARAALETTASNKTMVRLSALR